MEVGNFHLPLMGILQLLMTAGKQGDNAWSGSFFSILKKIQKDPEEPGFFVFSGVLKVRKYL